MKTSVIITYYNPGEKLTACLASLYKTENLSYQTVLVDDCSQDNSKKTAKKHPRIKLITLPENVGIGWSRNLGAQKTKSEYLVFLDIDCRLKKDTLSKLISALDANPQISLIQALLLNKQGFVESAGHFLSPLGFPYNSTSLPDKKTPFPVFGARGVLAVRRSLFEKIGGYDQDHRLSGEDTDLAWRVWLAGGSVYCHPKAIACHLHKNQPGPRAEYRRFRAGPQTMFSFLFKNMSAQRLFFILPLNILIWIIISLKLLVQGKKEKAFWIYQGLAWNIKNAPRTLAKRKKVNLYKKKKLSKKIIYGRLSWLELFRKALRWLKTH